MPTCCQVKIGPTLPAGHSGSVAGPWCCPVKIGPTLPARGAADVLRCRPVADVLPVVLPAGQLPAGCPTLPAGHSGSVAGPWCCPVKIGPTLPARGAADVLRCRPVADVLPVVLPAGQLPAGCPTLPAGHSGSVAGPWCCPVKIGPTLPARGAADVLRSRPVADVLPVVLPAGQLPAGCPTLPAGHSGSVAGPVVLPVKIGPTLPARGAADVLRSRPVADVLPVVLPAGCPTLPARHSGSVAGPVVLPGQDRPQRSRPVVLPTCCRPVNSSICGAITARRNRAV